MNLSAEDPRRSPRSKVLLAATLQRAGEALPVLLRDLSEYGALVRLEGTLDVDSEVWLHCNELAAQGYVAWVHDGHAGIVFSEPLKAEVMLAQIGWPQPLAPDEALYHRGLTARLGLPTDQLRSSRKK